MKKHTTLCSQDGALRFELSYVFLLSSFLAISNTSFLIYFINDIKRRSIIRPPRININ
nr:MAG TPA: hypothetical protein [Caudoviricetes sp.]